MTLKHTEKNIKVALRSGDANYKAAFDYMYSYYVYVDYKSHTNHCRIIDLIYKSNREFTIKALALHTFSSDSTLLRNRSQYVECFYFYLNRLSNDYLTEAVCTN